MSSVRVRAHAKINLSLRITGSRPDGFHDLRTVFQALALHDDLTFVERPGPFAIACGAAGVPCDETNLVWRAAALLWEFSGRAGMPVDVEVTLEKRIPVQGGLGGGSADAAAALRGLTCLWRLPAADADLLSLGARIGADVAFFLVGGAALGLGRGDCLFPLAPLPPLDVLLVLPGVGVSTREAYGWYDADAAAGLAEDGSAQDGGCVPGPWPATAAAVVNVLEAPVTRRLPGIAEAVRALRAEGAAAAAMSGSGSTVFGVFASGSAARRAARAMTDRGWRVVRTRTLGDDEYRRRSRVRRSQAAGARAG